MSHTSYSTHICTYKNYKTTQQTHNKLEAKYSKVIDFCGTIKKMLYKEMHEETATNIPETV